LASFSGSGSALGRHFVRRRGEITGEAGDSPRVCQFPGDESSARATVLFRDLAKPYLQQPAPDDEDGLGQTLNYAYDSLNRLASVSGSGTSFTEGNISPWSETYTYDGFGNLTDKTVTGGSAPSLSVVANTNNQLNTQAYDANGNTGGLFDYENRLISAGGATYSYGPDNLRAWKIRSDGSQDVYFYDPAGHQIAVYHITNLNPSGPYDNYCICGSSPYLWFAGQILGTDRLGSVGSFYPYGEQYAAFGANQDEPEFATYYYDYESGLDYAKNRFYSPTLGRFLSPDPYRNSAGLADPGSWNHYAYAGNDPVNFFDPAGLEQLFPENNPVPGGPYDQGGGGGGCITTFVDGQEWPCDSPCPTGDSFAAGGGQAPAAKEARLHRHRPSCATFSYLPSPQALASIPGSTRIPG
jgi:RHS repeat-associated protein